MKYDVSKDYFDVSDIKIYKGEKFRICWFSPGKWNRWGAIRNNWFFSYNYRKSSYGNFYQLSILGLAMAYRPVKTTES